MFPRKNISIRILILLASAALLILFQLYGQLEGIAKIRASRAKNPYIFHGSQFADFRALIGQATHVGYYTDGDVDQDPVSAMIFAQAQLILTPTILDLNNLEHDLILFHCRTPFLAIEKIKAIGGRPLRMNSAGIVLGQRGESAKRISAMEQPNFNKNQTPQRP